MSESSQCASLVEVLSRTGVALILHEQAPTRTQTDIERELGLPVELLLKTMVFHAGDSFALAALPIQRRVHYGLFATVAGVSSGRSR